MAATEIGVPTPVSPAQLQSEVDRSGSKDLSQTIGELLKPDHTLGLPAPSCFVGAISTGPVPLSHSLRPPITIGMQTSLNISGHAAAWISEGNEIVWQRKTDIVQDGFYANTYITRPGFYIFVLSAFAGGTQKGSWSASLSAFGGVGQTQPMTLVSYHRNVEFVREVILWYFDNSPGV